MSRLDARVVLGKAASRLIGTCCLLLLLFWNPLVLRPRFWNVRVFVSFSIIDAALLVCGVGLLFLRKSAALLCSGLAGYVGFTLAPKGEGPWIIIAALPLFFTVAFWRNLVWGNGGRDTLFSLIALLAIALVNSVAFLTYARSNPLHYRR